jgi:hypothetical protein
MQLQHCCLQQVQQQLQDINVSAHYSILRDLDWLLSASLCGLGMWNGLTQPCSSFSSSCGGVQLLRLSMLQVQLAKAASCSAAQQEAAEPSASASAKDLADCAPRWAEIAMSRLLGSCTPHGEAIVAVCHSMGVAICSCNRYSNRSACRGPNLAAAVTRSMFGRCMSAKYDCNSHIRVFTCPKASDACVNAHWLDSSH